MWIVVALAVAGSARPAQAGDAPPWMHQLVSRAVPPQDDKTNAVLLYSETNVTVLSADKIKTVVRNAYKILRPGGREYANVVVVFNSNKKVNNLRGWCIPAQGKDYEIKDKEAIEVSLPKVDGSELINDVRAKVLRIPAADPGNIVGYEYELEERPWVLQDTWDLQEEIPVLESHYSLQLPTSWEYKVTWLNTAEIKPSQGGPNQWQWSVTGQKAIRAEEDMPPVHGVIGRAVLSFLPPGGPNTNSFSNWQQMGMWYRNLTTGRTTASAEIKSKVAALTGQAPNKIAKARAIAAFVQHDIRYVAIELGIGGWQPHGAAEVFANNYGDCKDKVTLMSSMLREVGFDSFYVLINSRRGSVGSKTPAHNAFNHAILAVRLPDDEGDPELVATLKDTKLGTLLLFDPTDELTPFGKVSGNLQANYGLLIGPEGGELIEVPEQSASLNGIQRTGTLILDANGTLKGDVKEFRLGDRAWSQRWAQRTVANEYARIKPIESLLANSLAKFRITKATLVNVNLTDLPFGFEYSFEAENYAKNAGGLLLVRPRVLGSKSSALLETKEPRQFPVEFEAPVKDTDRFEITLPPGYEIDELPPAVDADFDFASYHSRTEAKGNAIAYTRTFEVKQLSVPVSKAEELKKFYRIIAGDERNTAVVKPKGN
jgi:hypothetical protein